MRRFLVLAIAVALVGCGAEGGGAASRSEPRRTTTTTTAVVTTTAPPTTTSTMPRVQAIEEMGAEIERACNASMDASHDPEIRYDSAWAPYGSRSEVLAKAKQCVRDRWAEIEEALRKAEEEQRQADERRRAEEEAALGTISQQNARRKASEYLDFAAFSRNGLIEQLVYEGFSEADAAFGIDALGVDWNEQAAKKAADYLDFSAFSRQGLLDQLLYEGFTQSQAEYGVRSTGL